MINHRILKTKSSADLGLVYGLSIIIIIAHTNNK